MSAPTASLASILGDDELSIIDIGARGSLAGQLMPIAASVNVIGFEPDEAECTRLNAALAQQSPWRSARVLPVAVGRTAKDRDFFIAREAVLSSLLRPNPDYSESFRDQVVEVVKLDTVSLDDLYKQGVLSETIDFIKVDTQGSELEILQSGETHILPAVLAIEVEAEFAEMYAQQPRFSEIEQYLRQQGFEFLTLQPRYSYAAMHDIEATKRRMTFCDAVFMRGRAWLAALTPEERARNLTRLATLHASYGLIGEAIELVRNYDKPLEQKLRDYAQQVAQPRFRWRGRLLISALRCALNPSRRNRLLLARSALMYGNRSGERWQLQDIHKST
ncbi:MAG: FkbM family methyltransferase [Chloroflexi bacterium]|nr:FkbM family methyltransferase [Chloroflexota bacterium]